MHMPCMCYQSVEALSSYLILLDFSNLLQDLQKLKLYLPLLENLVFHVDMASSNTQMVRWISNLRIQWAGALTGTLPFLNLMGPKYFQVNDIRFELGMNLFLYAAILRERALEVMPEGGHRCFSCMEWLHLA